MTTTIQSTVERIGVGPRMTQISIHNGTVYLAGQVAKANPGASAKAQTEEILAAIDARLAEAGTSKANLLMVQIILTDMKHFDGMNEAWDAWLPEGCAPGRACYTGDLNRAGLDVEFIVTAAR
ncbi:Enamine deaminase RidA, house cleaning of reactive enamine intermediates, YjgF/YER057c/UK114 family [Albimonas donghaensis]|uniref:Enamine deaminase RidA, house cleaning of reactive enamine intermediates, YjgF/YER057c/UK114 family n=1 Tax=Albimonas donghaensis TaxID=356660 RepID=A0A1H3DVA8_9RHOB|nr:RidA family protein [Albimonas donghaensis]SDX69614.1 Enamine deaminase RidA, house cleaning of reactive enamine intermediates, YjgF/YER057c/UK114 family [Albimonas donghaensis]